MKHNGDDGMVGIVFGNFVPLNQSDIVLMNKAVNECNTVIIAVCGYDKDKGKTFIPFQERYELVKNKYMYNPKVKVIALDERHMRSAKRRTIKGWEKWGTALFEAAQIDQTQECRWYCYNADYIKRIAQVYPNHTFTLVKT